MAYWWVNQNENYRRAIGAGTLWTLPDTTGSWTVGRKPILDLLPGDVVLHHANKVIRAVSQVTHAAQPHGRPPENPPQPGEVNDYDHEGQIVRVKVLRTDLDIPQEMYAAIIPHGSGVPGPLDLNGHAQRKYLQPLDPALAVAILALQDAVVIDRNPTPYGSSEGIAETDAITLTKLRIEQARLRTHLLQGADHGRCELCGHDYPADLLVAAHIQRRTELTDGERIQFDHIAMLACVLGCDALFEAGYIAVDTTGHITAGREATTTALTKRVTALIGRRCERHNSHTAARFAARNLHTLGSATRG